MLKRDFTTTSLVQEGLDCTQALGSLAKGTSNTQTLIKGSVMTHHQILLPSQMEMGAAALLAHFCDRFCVFTYGSSWDISLLPAWWQSYLHF